MHSMTTVHLATGDPVRQTAKPAQAVGGASQQARSDPDRSGQGQEESLFSALVAPNVPPPSPGGDLGPAANTGPHQIMNQPSSGADGTAEPEVGAQLGDVLGRHRGTAEAVSVASLSVARRLTHEPGLVAGDRSNLTAARMPSDANGSGDTLGSSLPGSRHGAVSPGATGHAGQSAMGTGGDVAQVPSGNIAGKGPASPSAAPTSDELAAGSRPQTDAVAVARGADAPAGKTATEIVAGGIHSGRPEWDGKTSRTSATPTDAPNTEPGGRSAPAGPRGQDVAEQKDPVAPPPSTVGEEHGRGTDADGAGDTPRSTELRPETAAPRIDAARDGQRPAFTRETMPQIVESVRANPSGEVELTLNPEELGRIRMSMSATDSGLQVTIQSDRAETAELLRRHISLLREELAGLGYAQVDIGFGGRQGDADPSTDVEETVTATTEAGPLAETSRPETGRQRADAGRLDMRL